MALTSSKKKDVIRKLHGIRRLLEFDAAEHAVKARAHELLSEELKAKPTSIRGKLMNRETILETAQRSKSLQHVYENNIDMLDGSIDALM